MDMAVLILKNIASEGPGTIEDFLTAGGIPFRIVDLQKEAIPDSGRYDTLVVLGGPMSVNDAEQYPFIKEEIRIVHEFFGSGRKVFGICLGAQIMAKALGSPVYAGPQKEIGWYDIELAEDALKDPLMKKLAANPRTGDMEKRFMVFHWHGETFGLPAGAVRLAGSALYRNQAFRYGRNAYAFQFHVEVTKEMIYRWLSDEAVNTAELRHATETVYEDFRGRAMNFYSLFFNLSEAPEAESRCAATV